MKSNWAVDLVYPRLELRFGYNDHMNHVAIRFTVSVIHVVAPFLLVEGLAR